MHAMGTQQRIFLELANFMHDLEGDFPRPFSRTRFVIESPHPLLNPSFERGIHCLA